MATQFGIALPQFFPDGKVDQAAVAAYIKSAEALGYHSGWVQEEILDTPKLDPLSVLSFAAGQTTRMKLGTAVLIVPLRSPIHLAKELSTIDQLSGGRLIVGLGLGAFKRDYPAFGVPDDRRARRYVEAIEVMKKLWTEQPVVHESEYRRFAGQRMSPGPFQRPHPPLWLAGYHPDALKRALRLGSGWIAGRISTPEFAGHVRTLRQLAEEAGRDLATFDIAKRVYIDVDADTSRIDAKLMHFFGKAYGSPDQAKRGAIYGSPAECVDRLGELVRAGAKLLILHPVSDAHAQMEILAREVMARF